MSTKQIGDPQRSTGKEDVANSPAKELTVVKAKKEPPPEASKAIQIRTCVVVSFWVIIVFFGLPLWWMTTTIYRAKLPLGQMMDWAEGRVGLHDPETFYYADMVSRLADQYFLFRFW
jgi:hypothetical protein